MPQNQHGRKLEISNRRGGGEKVWFGKIGEGGGGGGWGLVGGGRGGTRRQ